MLGNHHRSAITTVIAAQPLIVIPFTAPGSTPTAAVASGTRLRLAQGGRMAVGACQVFHVLAKLGDPRVAEG